MQLDRFGPVIDAIVRKLYAINRAAAKNPTEIVDVPSLLEVGGFNAVYSTADEASRDSYGLNVFTILKVVHTYGRLEYGDVHLDCVYDPLEVMNAFAYMLATELVLWMDEDIDIFSFNEDTKALQAAINEWVEKNGRAMRRIGFVKIGYYNRGNQV